MLPSLVAVLLLLLLLASCLARLVEAAAAPETVASSSPVVAEEFPRRQANSTSSSSSLPLPPSPLLSSAYSRPDKPVPQPALLPGGGVEEALLGQLQHAAKYAAISYCPIAAVRAFNCTMCQEDEGLRGTTHVQTFHSDRAHLQGFTALDHNRSLILISFRGSASHTNTLTNLDFLPSAAPPRHGLPPAMGIHAGFFDIYSHIRRGDAMGWVVWSRLRRIRPSSLPRAPGASRPSYGSAERMRPRPPAWEVRRMCAMRDAEAAETTSSMVWLPCQSTLTTHVMGTLISPRAVRTAPMGMRSLLPSPLRRCDASPCSFPPPIEPEGQGRRGWVAAACPADQRTCWPQDPQSGR